MTSFNTLRACARERHPNADLARALRHEERHHAGQSDSREQQRQRSQRVGKPGESAERRYL
ncbi:MAG: hypothetical protein ACREEM_31190 [Blastocatellia bacterium]